MIILRFLTILLTILLIFLAYPGECERIIDAYRAMITTQLEYNVTGWQQATFLRLYADLLRTDGGILCMQVGGRRQLVRGA